MDDEIESKLKSIADRAGEDLSWAKEQYQKKINLFRDKKKDDVSDDQLPRLAVASLQADVNENSRVQRDAEEIPMLSLGSNGPRPFGDGELLTGAAIVNPQKGGVINDDEDDPDPAGLAVILCREEEGADLGRMREMFQPLNTLMGNFSRRRSEKLESKGSGPVYILDTTEESYVEDEEIDGLPSERDEMRKLINQNFVDENEEFNLKNFTDHLTLENENGYPVDFGADIKRFRGHVTSYYRDQGPKDFGVYNLADNDIMDPDEIEGDHGGGDDPATITIWTQPEQVQYGEQSVVDVYGTVETDDDGDVVMNAYGIVPVIEFEAEHDDGEEGGEAEKGTI